MAVFKNYNFEYNAQRVDIFKSTVVCASQAECDQFKEGIPINIGAAGFYGVIANSVNAGEKLSLNIIAESWGRELRNTAITVDKTFRQINAIKLLKDHILPASWNLIYPASFDTYPRNISYILRNGTCLSHVNTVMDAIGLDFTIYSEIVGGVLHKYVKSYFRDDFYDRNTFIVFERKNIASLSVTVDYGKVATSITVMGAESEQGINQVTMDAEIKDWKDAPRVLEVKDTQLKKPEMSVDSIYFWYYPASETDYTIDQLKAGDTVVIDNERIKISSIWFLPPDQVASYVSGELTEDEFPKVLQPITSYVASGVIVASVVSASFTDYRYSILGNVTAKSGRALSEYGSPGAIHAVYDDVLITNLKVSKSKYFTFTKNLPTNNGFVWIGSERVFYRTASDIDGSYTLDRIVRGIPGCADSSCEHRGTIAAFRPVGYARGCPLVGGTDTGMETVCPLAKDLSTAFEVTNIQQCPLVFDEESPCPLLKCPKLQDFNFISAVPMASGNQNISMCPKGLERKDITYCSKYCHHKNTVVLPASYFYPASPNGEIVDTYEIYARDSLIAKYGYLSTRLAVKGIADLDGLDKIAEGRLRLSALPVVGKFTLLNYDPWIIPSSAFPGDVITITCASHGRYDHSAGFWYPTYWFDVSSTDPLSDAWMQVASNPASWVKITEQFVIQKTTKNQRGMPEITFGAGDISYQDTADYIAESNDTTSQRHRNQQKSKIIATSETGLAAQVLNLKTGEIDWVRMVL
jgi:hypothetical protein